MMYGDGPLLNLLAASFPISGWQNPVPIGSHLENFSLDPTIQVGNTCYLDRLDVPNPVNEIEYRYQRFTVNGERGVIFYPKDFFDPQGIPCLDSGGPRPVDLFIGCRATSGSLHATPYHLDQNQQACSSAQGPRLPNYAIPIFEQSLPYRSGADRHAIVVMGNGGSGNHPVWQMMQHNLTMLAYVRDNLANQDDYCFQVENTYLTGVSFGASIALLQSMLYPEEFDGALAIGAAGVGPEGFFGTERLQRAGYMLSNYGSEGQVPGSNVWIEDAWYLHEVQKLIQHSGSPTGETDALANASVLARLLKRENDQTALFYRPFILTGADEDATTLAHLFRHAFDAVLATTIPGSSDPYSKFGKILPFAFHEHSGRGGEGLTILLHPDVYFPNSTAPANGNVVDWLKQLYADWQAHSSWIDDANLPAIEVDEGVEALNQASDYVLSGATITSPPDQATGTLAMTQMWTDPPPNGNGRGFLGTGIEPGLNHNLFVEDLDEDTSLEVVYGEAGGFVHVLEWDEASSELVFEWRSPDMGTAITGLDVGTFAKPGGGTMKGIMAISHSGELWGIWYDGTTSQYQAKSFTGPLVYGGERENPDLAIGPHSGGVTPVYIVGTGTAHANQQDPSKPNACRLQRLDVTDITAATFTESTAEDFEPVTELFWDDSEGELVAGSARGYFGRLEDSSGNFVFDSAFSNFGLSDYLKMTPCQIRKVTVSSTTVYLIAGIPGDNQDYDPSTDVERNLIAVGASGTVLTDGSSNELRALAQEGIDLDPSDPDNGRKIYMPIECFEVLANDGSKARLAVGAKDGIHFYDFDLTSGFTEVTSGSDPVLWSPQRWLKSGEMSTRLRKAPVLSLEAANIGGEGRLFGTTIHGLIFVADVPTDVSTVPAPTLLHHESPLCLAYGLKGFAESFSSLGQAVNDFGADVNLTPTLNVVAQYSYFDDLADAFGFTWGTRAPAGSGFIRINALTGLEDVRRARDLVCRTFNPDRRASALTGAGQNEGNVWNSFWSNQVPLDLDEHVFQETVDVGELVQVGQWDLSAIGDQNVLVNKGQLLTILDYLAASPSSVRQPDLSTGIFMLDDRYYNASTRAFGGAVRMGNLDDANGSDVLEVVLSTNGGRLVTYAVGSSPWTSWVDSDPSADPTGDYGWTLAGLATYNIDPPTSGDTLDEVFAVGATYTDSTDPGENDSHLMIFEADSSSDGLAVLTRIFNGDLGEAGCTGLWVGPALGNCACQNKLDVIVGQAQTFAIYSIDRTTKTVDLATPRYRSVGLGSGIGAFNSIEVLRNQVDPADPNKRVDYVFLGSDAYVYAFKTPPYLAMGGGHQH